MKSAAIFALLATASAVTLNSCIESGVDGAGLTCVPGNSQLFSTGMNGDEDLGEDIIMKGKPFHYNQKLAQGKEAPEEGSEAEEKAEAKEDSKMAEAEAKATKAKTKNVEPVEKVSVLESAIAKEHTTFYDKQAPKQGEFVQLNGDGVKGYEDVSAQSEKVSVLDIGQNTLSNSYGTVISFPDTYRSAYYVQIDDDTGVWKL